MNDLERDLIQEFIDHTIALRESQCQHWWRPLRAHARVALPEAPSAFKLRMMIMCTLCGKVEIR